MHPGDLEEVMHHHALFLPLSDSDRRMMKALVQNLEVKPGETIIEEGVPSDGLYLIYRGKFRVQRKCQTHSEDIPLLDLGPGDMMGEFSLIQPIPATATVAALEPSAVGRILREDFQALISRETPMAARVLRVIAEHLVDKLIRTSEIIRQWHDVSRCLCLDDSFRELYRTWHFEP